MTVSPDGKNAYVASQFSNAVTVFDRGADGTLIQKPEPEQSNQRATRCMRRRALPGGFTLSADAGRNRFTFMGRLRGRKLPPGRYRLRAGATDPSGNTSRTGRVRFGIAGR